MNSRELRCAAKLYDLLSMRQRLDILTSMEDFLVSIRPGHNGIEAEVLIIHTVDVVKITSEIKIDTTVPPEDELDIIEYRLAYKTLDHLLGVHHGK